MLDFECLSVIVLLPKLLDFIALGDTIVIGRLLSAVSASLRCFVPCFLLLTSLLCLLVACFASLRLVLRFLLSA